MEVSEILEKAYRAWCRCSDLRARRNRCKRFTYGDQWNDPVENIDGTVTSEYEFLLRSGKRPYTNNLLRQLVKSVVGRFRSLSRSEELYRGDIATLALSNDLAELDAREMEEFLISGCAIQRIVRERRRKGSQVWIDSVDPRRFFVNAFQDPRGWDIDLIGMLHDMRLPELINRYAGGDRRRAAEIADLYRRCGTDALPLTGTESTVGSFFVAAGSDRCRVIEVWSFDSRPCDDGSSNSDFVWHCRIFAPDGTLLFEYDSPYAHGSHPFEVMFYPLTDGEVHSFVEDVLDQQKFINRLIVVQDHILSCSAKGVLIYPLSQLPKHTSIEAVQKAWARADGLIPIEGKNGMPLPQQMFSSGVNPGAAQLLDMQMRLFEQVSGVGNALMGRSTGARGAEMLESEVENATIALTDIFDTFSAFIGRRNRKALQA